MVSRSDEADRFVMSLPIGKSLARLIMIDMARAVMRPAKKPVPSESSMSIIEWMEKMEEAEQQSSLLKRRPTPHAP